MKIKEIHHNPVLYVFRDRKIRCQDLLKALRELKIKRGDIIFIHSDLSVFGKIGEVRDRAEFMSLILKAFEDVVGEEGTIIMPTFTYSFCNNKAYDLDLSPSTVGVFTEYFRRQKGVVRTVHPIFSVAIWGKEKKFFNTGLGRNSFDQNSIFGKLYKKRAKIVFFGASFQSCTFIHYIERIFGVPYRYHKIFYGNIINKKRVFKAQYDYFVRPLDKNIKTDLSRFEKRLIKKRLMNKAIMGAGEILVIKSKDLFEEGIGALEKDLHFFLKTKQKYD